MKAAYPTSLIPNPIEVLRKAGYAYFRDPQSGEESFVIRLTTEYYPRFHLYVEAGNNQVIFNLHLDQKKPSYGNETKHSGEYTGPVVEKEMARIDSWVRANAKQATRDTAEHDIDEKNRNQQKKLGQDLKSWWKNLFKR